MPNSTALDIDVQNLGPTIRPELHGHFIEHLGGCIDGGLWVGTDSPIPNTDGVRNDVVEALSKISAPVLRWPGGCFADDYHWRDGIGPRESRPRRVNMHWGGEIERNEFGTHEFIATCRAVGAKPYLAGNVGSGTPRELRDWVEYCNFPGGSTLSDERVANGSNEPFAVEYWGVGNENWGCGGTFSPEDYATEYRRFSTYLRPWGGTQPFLIACGPNRNDSEWTRRFFEKLKRHFWDIAPIHGFAAHHYSHSDSTATEFEEKDWIKLLLDAIETEKLIVDQRALLDEYDPDRKIGLILDEWGAWHKPTPGTNPAFLWQQSTVRDALVAAVSFDIFHRQAERVHMTNIAQTINVLQSLILTDEEKMVLTPTYHVFDLYRPHQNGQRASLRLESAEIEGGLPHIAGSASVKHGVLTLTVTNLSPREDAEIEVRLPGVNTGEIAVRGLAYDGDLRAHNEFGQMPRVGLEDKPMPKLSPSGFGYVLPSASVTRFSIALG
ncbi:alpha-N-arabinofuranosidase [bacterium]|nr:MAG: alpha-N-arabinofuranosidase [bacterium]